MVPPIMKPKSTEKITITLPSALYHQLRNEAHRQGITLPEIIRKKVQLQPSEPSSLAKLPLSEIIAQTTPKPMSPEARLDFYS